jgi:hypothetical protein
MGVNKRGFSRTRVQELELAETAIQRFLGEARQPALLEPGEELLPLEPDRHAVVRERGRLLIRAWDEGARHVVRAVTGVREERSGRLELTVEKFAKRQGRLYLLDLARAEAQKTSRKAGRLAFAEQFRRLLARDYPEWRIRELSSEPDLEHTLSPVHPRALLTRGAAGLAAMAAPEHAADGVLSFALIWVDYLRFRSPEIPIAALALYLPEGGTRATCLRLPFLDPAAIRCAVHVYAADGRADWLDPADWGNLETRLEPWLDASAWRDSAAGRLAEAVSRLPGIETVEKGGGELSFRVRGLEVARAGPKRLLFGLPPKHTASGQSLREIERLAAEVARIRSAASPDTAHPLWRAGPEAWLESQVRAHPGLVHPLLARPPLYGQVPAMAGGDRGIIDLLGVDATGRLHVVELKCLQDVHLPLQALDYWMRVQWHLEREEFPAAGYFAGQALSPAPPRLLLVAPAFEFHPTTEIILRFLKPSIETERIGLALEWRKDLRVLFRLRGGDRAQPLEAGEPSSSEVGCPSN